jgi:hypothetical protein
MTLLDKWTSQRLKDKMKMSSEGKNGDTEEMLMGR